MRKIVLAAAIGLIVLAVGVPAASAGFTNPYLLRLVGVEEQFDFVDVGAPGESVGDGFFLREGLYRWSASGRRGAKVGRLHAHCTFPTQGPVVECIATAFVPKGTLVAGGFFRFGREFTIPVLGGTGIYRNVGGVIRLRELPGARTAYVFRLTR